VTGSFLTTCRSILTDEFLRVKGSNGSIFAIGDAATIDQPKALDYAEELFSVVGEPVTVH
jgi:NADH:ubiquinone reductase (non-electrogenic)